LDPRVPLIILSSARDLSGARMYGGCQRFLPEGSIPNVVVSQLLRPRERFGGDHEHSVSKAGPYLHTSFLNLSGR